MTPPSWPWWAPWLLWSSSLAAAVAVASNVIKLVFYKRRGSRWHGAWSRQRGAAGRAALLLPWQAGLGVGLGVLLFPEADLIKSPVLAGFLGLLVGMMSWSIYDAMVTVPSRLVSLLTSRAADAAPPEDGGSSSGGLAAPEGDSDA